MPYFHHFMAESIVNNSKCCTSQVKNTNGLTKTVKSGYLLHYKKRMFCKAWREAFVVLYSDSSLVWFRDRDRNDSEGAISLKDAPEMLAAGQWTSRVPFRPEFPSGFDPKLSIAIGSRNREKVNWFLCKSETELIDWMSAINYTLPLPPPPPEELRDSRRNLTSSNNSVDTFAPLLKMNSSMTSSMTSFVGDASRFKTFSQLRHQPSAPDLFLNKVNRSSVQNFQKLSGSTRSYSTGKMNHLDNHVDWTRVSGLSTSTSSTASTSGRDKRVIKRSNSFRDSQNTDLAPAMMVAAIMTQWNVNADCWDWGMGWGWAGWSASYCDTCALEHAAVTAHVASTAGHNSIFSEALADPKSHLQSSSFRTSQPDLFVYDDDNEVDVGDTDVACDFGGDFGGF